MAFTVGLLEEPPLHFYHLDSRVSSISAFEPGLMDELNVTAPPVTTSYSNLLQMIKKLP